jgi:hypothetical protein
MMGSVPEHNPKQASHTMPTAEEVTLWDVGQFIAWTKELKPRPIPDDKIAEFEKANFRGAAFLAKADQEEYFERKFGLSIGDSIVLADLAKQIKEGEIAGIKSKFTIFIHAHYVNCKLTTSQETDSRPKMWGCPAPPIALVSPPTTHLCCSLYANPYYCRAFNSHIGSNHQSVCPLQIASKVDYGLPSRIP